jgi:hypothetical protein
MASKSVEIRVHGARGSQSWRNAVAECNGKRARVVAADWRGFGTGASDDVTSAARSIARRIGLDLIQLSAEGEATFGRASKTGGYNVEASCFVTVG